EMSQPVGALQGFVRFDARRLRYVGQSLQAGEYLAVNAKNASNGELHVGAVDAQGFERRIGTLVFEVTGPDTRTALRLDPEIIATVKNQRFLAARSPEHVRAAANLVVPSNPKVMTLADMRASLGLSASTQMIPGQIPTGFAGLQFGN